MSLVIDRIRQLAAESPDRVALTGEGVQLTRAELVGQLDVLAAALQATGLQRIGLVGDNSPGWVLADLALCKAGLMNVPVPGFFSPAQVEHLIRQAGLQALVGLPQDFSLAQQQSLRPLPSGLAYLALPVVDAPQLPGRDISKVTFTSGSTGKPRGVCLTAGMMDATVAALAAELSPLMLPHHLTVLPLATLLENIAGVWLPLFMGAKVTLKPLASLGFQGVNRFDLPSLIGVLNDVQPASLILVPQLLQALVIAGEMKLPLPASLRFIAVGGARVAPALLKRAQSLGLPVFEGYGLSECGSVVTLNTPSANRPGTTGRPLGHVEVRLSGSGEVLVRGNVMSGYLGDAEGPGEWLHTGDLGRFDADGFLQLDGRSKNLFITACGRNVSPEWLESELLAQTAIQQVAVFGEAMVAPVAIVVARAGFNAGRVGAAIAAVNRHLPGYARIQRFLVLDEPFSAGNGLATANGRVIRNAVAARYAAALETCSVEPALEGSKFSWINLETETHDTV